MHPFPSFRLRPAAGRPVLSVLFALALLLAAGSLGAQIRSLPMATPGPLTAAAQSAPAQPPLRIAESFGVEPLASMSRAQVGAGDQLEALATWNRSGGLPVRVGFFRPLPLEQTVRLDRTLGRSAAGIASGGAYARAGLTTVWGTAVRVEDSYRIRLHLSDVSLPPGAQLWVYGETGETVGPFGNDLIDDDELLTPSVAGPVIYLEVELPAAAAASGGEFGFRLDRVAEIVRLDAQGTPQVGAALQPQADDCIVDASCVDSSTFPVVNSVRKAIAHLEFPVGGFIGLCTGSLLNTAPDEPGGPSPEPPLLTANHCFSTQTSASGLEAFWDDVTPTCNGAPPALGSLPRTTGSTLLATGIVSDYTLVAPSSLPADRVLLGWNADPSAVAPNTMVHRISHPVPSGTILPQSYTRYRVLGSDDAAFQSCGTTNEGHQTDDTSKFLHLEPVQGGTFGGSSGASTITDNGQVVGQLFAGCGPDPADGCNMTNNDLDGAFQTTFDRIMPFLIGGNPGPPSDTWLTTPEQPGFEFQGRITPLGDDSLTAAKVGDCFAESLCMSGALFGRPEVVVKIIGPRPNGFLWVQISRFTPSAAEVWVRRTATGDVKYYRLDAVSTGMDDVPGVQDRRAFAP